MENRKKMFFKYDENDILEILTEHLAENNGFETYNSHAVILGTPSENLRLIAVVGESEDETLSDVDLEKIDKEMDFNGDHSHASWLNQEDINKIDFNDF